jgi:AraC-like DNA-binding protein
LARWRDRATAAIVCEMTKSAPSQTAFVGRERYPGLVVPVAVRDGLPARAGEPRFAILHIVKGSGIVEGPRGRQLVAAPAALLLDDVALVGITRTERLSMRAISFHPSVVNSAFSPDGLRQTPVYPGTSEQDAYLLRPFVDPAHIGRALPLTPALNERLSAAARNIDAEGAAQRDMNWPCRTRSFLIELLFQLRVLVDEPAARPAEPSGSRLDQALLLAHDRAATDFTVADLARWCGTNRTTLNAYFRTLTGQSVRAYVIGLRIKMAAALLRDTLLPVTEIMTRVGYDNPSNFTRQFRKSLGIGPRDYRKAESWMLPRQ